MKAVLEIQIVHYRVGKWTALDRWDVNVPTPTRATGEWSDFLDRVPD